MIRPNSLEHSMLELSGPSQGDGRAGCVTRIHQRDRRLFANSPMGLNLVVVSAPTLQLFRRSRKRQEPRGVQ